MIERQIESPIPMPPDLVVKKASNSRSALCVGIPTPVQGVARWRRRQPERSQNDADWNNKLAVRK